MKQILFLITLLGSLLFVSTGLAQEPALQQVTLSGIIKTEGDAAEGTKVAIHVVDKDGVWQREIANTSPIAGTFSVSTSALDSAELSTLRNGSVLLPGLQNEYTISPSENVNYAVAAVNVYVDANGNTSFDRIIDAFYIGVAGLESPLGFFKLIYVDQDVTLSGRGIELELESGWNIFTVRFPENSDASYEVASLVDDVVMDVFLP